MFYHVIFLVFKSKRGNFLGFPAQVRKALAGKSSAAMKPQKPAARTVTVHEMAGLRSAVEGNKGRGRRYESKLHDYASRRMPDRDSGLSGYSGILCAVMAKRQAGPAAKFWFLGMYMKIGWQKEDLELQNKNK